MEDGANWRTSGFDTIAPTRHAGMHQRQQYPPAHRTDRIQRDADADAQDDKKTLLELKLAQDAHAAQIAHIAQLIKAMASPTTAPTAQTAPPSIDARRAPRAVYTALSILSVIMIIACLNWALAACNANRRDAVWYLTTSASSRTRRNSEVFVYTVFASAAIAFGILLIMMSSGYFYEKVPRQVHVQTSA